MPSLGVPKLDHNIIKGICAASLNSKDGEAFHAKLRLCSERATASGGGE